MYGQPAALNEQAVLDAYRQHWLERERAATNEPTRIALAAELLEAARAAKDDAPRAVLLCQRAYHFGAMQRASYAPAAEALELMAELEPARKIESLEKLSKLYQTAYHENTSANLGMGMGTADAMALVARERHRQLEQQIQTDGIEMLALLVEANRVLRDWQVAQRTAGAVINSARSLERRLAARDANDVQLVRDFLAKHEPSLERYEKEVQAAGRFKDTVTRLVRADPDAIVSKEERTEIGWLYLAEFNAPAKAKPYADAFLAPAHWAFLDIAAKPVDELETQEHLDLAGWYADLSEVAPEGRSQRNLLGRAAYLLAHCDGEFDASDQKLARAKTLAQRLDTKAIELKMALLGIRVNPRPGSVAPRPEPQTPRVATVDVELPREEPPALRPAPTEKNVPSHDLPKQPDASTSYQRRGDKPLPRPSWLDDDEDNYWTGREKSIFDLE